MKLVVTYEHGLISSAFGGGQRILIEILLVLTQNHSVLLITPGHESEPLPLELIGCKNFQIKFTERSHVSVISGLRVFKAAVNNILRQKNVQVISFTSELYWLSLLRKFRKFRLSAYLAAPDLEGFEKKASLSYCRTIRKRLELFLFMLGFKHADNKIAIGNKIKLQAEKYFNISDINVQFPGIGLVPQKKIYNNEIQNLSFLYLGRLELTQKPITKFLEFLTESDVIWKKIHIVGDGPDKQYLQKKFNSPRFVFHGNRSLTSLQSIVDEVDIAILPSASESFMLTAYEMIKVGLPIICNDVADLKVNIGHLESVRIVENCKAGYDEALRHLDRGFIGQEVCMKSSQSVTKNFSWHKLANALINCE